MNTITRDIKRKYREWLIGVSSLLLCMVTVQADANALQNAGYQTQDMVLVQMIDSQNESEKEMFVTMKVTELELSEALDLLAEKLHIGISYKTEVMPDKMVSLDMNNVPIYEVLNKLLEDTGLEPVLTSQRDVIVLQEKESDENTDLFQETVRGQVVDSESGESIPGVNVMIQGTSIGTVTTIDGEFELEVSDLDQVLVISYIGYERLEIPLQGRTEINVELVQSVAEMDELVVTAFGLERQRKALGYSVQSVDGVSLSTAREVNVANSLQGRVAGVHVSRSSAGAGGSSSITIRGSSSLAGNNQPLYVIDGVPIDNTNLDPASHTSGRDYGDGIGDINPDDIESMTVLKGPSAAALYGSRGANGVILVTTKRADASQERMEVTVNTGATFDFLNVLPRFQNKWGGGYGGGYGSFGTREVDGTEYPMYTNSMWDHWGGEMDGRLITVQNMPEIGVVPYSPQPTGNIREVYRTGQTLNNSISFSGGSGSTAFRLSLADMRNQHILPTTELDRQSINLNFSTAVRDNVSIQGRINYISQQGKNRPEVGFGRGSASIPAALNELARFVDLDWLKNYQRPDGTQVNYQSRVPQNPYWIMNEMLSEDSRRRVIGHLTVNYEMTDWLSFQARGGTDFYNDARFERVAPGSYGGGNIDGYVVNNDWSVSEDNIEVMLTADRDFTADFSGLFSIGANHLSQSQEVRGFRGNQIIAPEVYDIGNTQQVIPRNRITNKEINSVYGLAQFGFRNYLFLDLTGRNDWSSTLPVENRSFFYPSATVSFSFTDVMNINPDFLTYGKLRLSVATAGNDADPYLTNIGYSIDAQSFRGARFASMSNTIPVVDLKNELTTSYEIGTDLRFFDNRMGIDFTYYQSSTKDQILPIEISSTSGYSSRLINAGEIANEGYELMFNVVPVQSTSFMWDVNLNISSNKSEVVELAEGLESLNLIQQGNANIEARPGLPFGNIVGFEYLKNEEGRRVLNQNGGLQRGADQVVLGNIQPDYLGGITNTLVYRGISLSALVDFRIGGEVFSHTKYRQLAQGTGYMTLHREEEMYLEGVIQNEDGTYRENDMPVNAQSYYAPRAWSNVGEEFVIDADYAALREVTLGYEFGESLLSNLPITSARFSIVGRNLFYLYRDEEFKLMGIAPEGTFNTSTAAMGFETANLPTTRSIGFNLSFSL
jgi:TonB-linked SusC/RagA family outer membrane protein